MTMKHYCNYILLLLAVFAITACGGRSDNDNLTDGQKLELLDIKIDKNPNDASLLADRARILMNLGRAKDATHDIDRAVELQPGSVEYRLIQADAHFANGNADKCYQALGEAERMEPDNKEVQLKMGEVTFYRKDYERSLRHLTNVTEKEPDNRTALFMKGFIYKEMGDTAGAVTLLRKVCDLYPDYAPAFEELGVLYATRLDPMAVEYLGTALRLEPSNTNCLYALAMYHQERGEMEEAESLYRNILDINENSADAWHNLGYIEMLHYRDYQRAVEYFDHALECDPNMEAAQVNRQLALDAMK